MSIGTLKIKAEILENEIGSKTIELNAIRQEIAEISCPFSVGETIVNQKDGLIAIVSKITYSGWRQSFNLFGNKIKKDGQPYKYDTEFHYPESWVKAVKS